MRVPLTKRLFLSSFAILALSSCAAIKFPDVKACSVAGVLIAGASCDQTGSSNPSQMGAQEFIDWLEDEQAICISSKDYARQKSSIEQACVKMGRSCAYEVRKDLEGMSGRIDKIIEKGKENQ